MTAVGDELPEWTLDAVDAERMKVLALLLADPNPLHYDPSVARRLGIADRPVAQGPATMAMLANLVRSAFPAGRLARLSVRLHGSVVAGQGVRAHGTVADRWRDANGDEVVRCELALDTGDRTVLQGDAEVVLRA